MTQQAKKELDALDQELENLIGLLSPYTHEQLNTLAPEGGWSAMQCLHHIMLAELNSQKYVQKKLSFNPTLEDYSPIKEWGRSLLLKTFMTAPFKVNAPSYLSGEYLPAESNFEETIQAWKAQRADLRNYLNGLDKSLFRKGLMKHPFAGRISLKTTLVFFRGHQQRHLKQAISTLKN